MIVNVVAQAAALSTTTASGETFLGAVNGLTGGGNSKLDGQTTVGVAVPRLYHLSLNDDVQTWKLRAKGGGEVEDGVSFVLPDDYHASTNDKIFVRVQ